MGKLLVTGAGGYVGGRVVESALGRGDEVHALWRSRRPPEGAILHQVELADAEGVRSAIEAAAPEVVIHAAYDMAAGVEPNLLWSRNVFSAARSVDAKVVFLSTDLVFDGNRGWYREDDEPNPTLPYGEWKLALERDVLADGGVVARTSLVWGIDPPPDHVEGLVLAPLREGREPRLFEDEWRTPTEVHDLAEALIQATRVAGPRVLHFAGPERISRLEFGRLFARRHGFDPERLPPVKRAEVAPNRPADTSLLVESTREVVDVRFRGPTELLDAS